MAELKPYSKPEIHEVLLDVSQAVLAVCKSGVNNANQNRAKGYCRTGCKRHGKKAGSNSTSSS
jgi:hypothetical protein